MRRRIRRSGRLSVWSFLFCFFLLFFSVLPSLPSLFSSFSFSPGFWLAWLYLFWLPGVPFFSWVFLSFSPHALHSFWLVLSHFVFGASYLIPLFPLFTSRLPCFLGGAPSGLRGGKEEREGGFLPSFSSFFSSFVLVPLFFSCVSHLYTQYSHHTPIHTYTYMRPSPIASFLVERGREDWLRPKLPIFAFLSVGEEGDRRQT